MSVYFDRYAYPHRLFKQPPRHSLSISIVIPCFNEPNIKTTLDSLKDCRSTIDVEVIIIINEAEDSPIAIQEANKKTAKDINDWRRQNNFSFTLLTHHLTAPKKDAGVGLARKVGMDEACRRFDDIKNKTGIICCFDADSTCSPNYINSIHEAFKSHDPIPVGASIHFEHPIPEDELEASGIIQYELHLRYYVNALRLINYPYAHHTIGSSMAVRTDIYERMGGMNKRKAGEDFYFLHRLMPYGNFIDIGDATVYPSPRVSNRVPFGTGKAMGDWMREAMDIYLTYNLNSFMDLGFLFDQKEEFYKVGEAQIDSLLDSLPDSIQSYLKKINFLDVLERLKRQSKSEESFSKNWFLYFDGFWILKFIHFSRENFHPNLPVTDEARRLALHLNNTTLAHSEASQCLEYFRLLDRN